MAASGVVTPPTTAGAATPGRGSATPGLRTPGSARRTRFDISGLTPTAKRPNLRLIMEPSTEQNVISHDEMQRTVRDMHTQYAHDMQWIASIYDAVQDHAARLDINQSIASDTASQLVATRKVVADNDAFMKATLAENDATSKAILEANDLETKNTLRDNDNLLKQTLASEAVKIEKLMVEAQRLQQEMDKTQANLQMVQQATGNMDAIKATANQLQNQDEQIRQIWTGFTEIEYQIKALKEFTAAAAAGSGTSGPATFATGPTTFGSAASGVDPLQGAGDAWASARAAAAAAAAIGVPPGISVPAGAGGAEKKLSLYDDKTATMPERRYSDKDVAGWRIMTQNYWISRAPDMIILLKWIENHKDEEITSARMM